MFRPAMTLSAIVALSLTAPGLAQCDPIDFENFADGTTATNLIPGVTFTATPGSCGSGPFTEIYTLTGGPEGTTNIVAPRQGCPEFNPDGVLMTFDENQSFVQFRVACAVGADMFVRWYNEFGTPLGTRMYNAASGTGLLVTIENGAGIIGSVEVRHVGDFHEGIDDLVFGLDETPPTVEIDSPTFDQCVCGDSTVGIVGTVDDLDGTYECDTAEYRPINAEPEDPWTQFGFACGAFSGTLHSLNTTGMPAGRYYVRITGTNECGLSQSDITVIRVDRAFDSIGLNVDETLCGVATIDGGISDRCGLTWELHQRPVGGGTWVLIDEDDSARSCEIADWDTTTVPDGEYRIRLRGTDGCGHFAQVTQDIFVDNAGCDTCTADINGDGVVDVNDLLLVLGAWGG